MGSRKKVVRPLRGGGIKAGPLRKEDPMTTKLEGEGGGCKALVVGPLLEGLLFWGFTMVNPKIVEKCDEAGAPAETTAHLPEGS